MKKILVALVCLCILLSGCGAPAAKPAETLAVSLPELGTPLEDGGNVVYIPYETVETMIAPQMQRLGKGLLLSEHLADQLTLHHISLEDGGLLATASYSMTPDAKVLAGEGQVGICDRETGAVTILDDALQPQKTYQVTPQGSSWYLNPQLDTLYIFDFDRGLLARDLESGQEQWLLDNGFQVAALHHQNGYVIFRYTDRATQMTDTRCLELATGQVELLPVDGLISQASRQGDTWLMADPQQAEHYLLNRGDTTACFYWPDPAIALTSQGQLLAADPSGRQLMLYQADGSFLSQCDLPQSSSGVVGEDFVWVDQAEGYFFLDHLDGICRLMFWHVEHTQGKPLEMCRHTQTPLDSQVYDRARQLSQRFGVEILVADQCALEYTHHTAPAVTDPGLINEALDIVERCLAKYPEGFFRQLPYGSVRTISLELVGTIRTTHNDGHHNEQAGGFAQNLGSRYLIAVDAVFLTPSVLHHEISHVIDKRLAWDSEIRPESRYSEEAWLALQPEGFAYAQSYTQIPDSTRAYLNSGYFVREYGMTYPTEDRATLMESALEGHSWDFPEGSGARAKLEYYAACIRDCFDTATWPEVTTWEQTLQE